jgi:hypothetical protein
MSEVITIKNFTATYWAIIIFFIYIGNGEFIVRHGQIQNAGGGRAAKLSSFI